MLPSSKGKGGGLASAISHADPQRRQVRTGMHGPTCIFWASLTPFPLQWSKQSFGKRGWWRLKSGDAMLRASVAIGCRDIHALLNIFH
jgi:hypothetical protein